MLNGLKGFFFEEDKSSQNNSSQSPVTQVVQPTRAPIVTGPSDVKYESDVRDSLMVAIKNNSADPSCLSFLEALKSMESSIPDERTRITAALSALKAMGGGDSSKLLSSIASCLTCLDAEQKKFLQQLDAESKARIGDSEQILNGLASTIDLKQKQIKQLSQEITEIQNSLIKQQTDHSSLKQKFETLKNTYLNVNISVGDLFRSIQNKISMKG